jgi:2-oxoglutarate dehydrogenase E2 component (dihydrolipoamide succinyltransferase)
MAIEIIVPSVGESITEGILSRWFKKDGTAVKENEPLFELETDKAAQEIPSPADGILSVAVAEGSKVQIGDVVGHVEAGTATPAPGKPRTSDAEKTPEPARPKAAEKTSEKTSEPILSPAARQMAADAGINPSRLTGSGREGRVLKEDVLSFLEREKPVSPPAPPPPSATPRFSDPPSPTRNNGERETRERMSGIRQRIAARLVEAQSTAAILTTFNEIDMSAVMALRAKYKDAFQKKHGVGLGFMSFFVKAAVEALRAFPLVNARVEGNDIVHCHYHDIGVAVSTERGLMVPVVRDCDQKNFAAVEREIIALANKAREGKITVGDLQGGTFTITNGGVFGSLLSTPILNPPQSGILGMHTIQKRPVAVNDQVVIRPMMYVALSYDHRIVDGREAVSFLVRVKECVENPERVLLEI